MSFIKLLGYSTTKRCLWNPWIKHSSSIKIYWKWEWGYFRICHYWGLSLGLFCHPVIPRVLPLSSRGTKGTSFGRLPRDPVTKMSLSLFLHHRHFLGRMPKKSNQKKGTPNVRCFALPSFIKVTHAPSNSTFPEGIPFSRLLGLTNLG